MRATDGKSRSARGGNASVPWGAPSLSYRRAVVDPGSLSIQELFVAEYAGLDLPDLPISKAAPTTVLV